jgi:outer membrane protein assembly factor BamB
MKAILVKAPRTTPAMHVPRMVVLLIAGAIGFATAIASPRMGLAAGGLSMTSFKPTSGPVGTVVTITGTGFTSGDIVTFNGTSTSASTANAAGTKLKASVPPFATTGLITVTNPFTGQTVGLPGTVFRVRAGLFASPNHEWAGGTLMLSGSALSPNQSVPIHLGKVVVGEARTNANGDFNSSVAIPANTPSGKTSLYVIDTLGRFTAIVYINGDWPSFRHDPAHTGLDTYEPALSPSTVSGLTHGWNYTTGAAVGSSPAVFDGVVYIGSLDGNMYALNASTGAVEWTFNAGTSIGSSPAVANGMVYFASEDGSGGQAGSIYALNATTGALVWFSKTGAFDSSPEVANGVVYVASGHAESSLYALNAATGSVDWTYATGEVTGSPAVAGGVVYVASFTGVVYALKAATGTLNWSYTIGVGIESSPAVVNGVVYVGAFDGSIYALNAVAGTTKWAQTIGTTVESSPAVANGLVYVGSDNGKVYALNASTGAVDWTYATGDAVTSSPAVANGVVYVGSDDQDLYALNATTGTKLWSATTGGAVTPSPAVADGSVYVGSEDDNVYAYGL